MLCPPGNSHTEALIPRVTVSGRRAFGRETGHEGRVPMGGGISALVKRETREVIFFCHVKTQQGGTQLQIRSTASQGTQSASTLTLEVPASRTVRTKSVV